MLKESVGMAESLELLMMEDEHGAHPEKLNTETLKKLVTQLKLISNISKECIKCFKNIRKPQ